jgi:hypothetical protein
VNYFKTTQNRKRRHRQVPPLPMLRFQRGHIALPPEKQVEHFQFGLQAYLGMFVVLAVFFSYLRWFEKDPRDAPRFGGALAVAYAAGGVIGYYCDRFNTAMFWVGIGTAQCIPFLRSTADFWEPSATAYASVGFCNRDVAARLYPTALAEPSERTRTSSRISYCLRILRSHGLIRKSPGRRRYHMPPKCRQIATALLHAQHAAL